MTDDFLNIQAGMNAAMESIKLISQNIANINTPNYKRKYINLNEDFSNNLNLALQKTDSRHISNAGSSGGYNIKEDDTNLNEDGNSVDIDTEVVELAKNNLYYQSLGRLFTTDVAVKRIVIGGK